MSKKTEKTEENNGKFVYLTKEVESDEKILGSEGVKMIKNLRRKYPDADLSLYRVKVNE